MCLCAYWVTNLNYLCSMQQEHLALIRVSWQQSRVAFSQDHMHIRDYSFRWPLVLLLLLIPRFLCDFSFPFSLFSYWNKFSMNAPIRWAFHFHACHLQQLAFWSLVLGPCSLLLMPLLLLLLLFYWCCCHLWNACKSAADAPPHIYPQHIHSCIVYHIWFAH